VPEVDMILVLEIDGSRAGVFGRDSRFLFKSRGGTIGSAAGNDWMLPDPGVSPVHALIEYSAGYFTMTGVGSTPIGHRTPERPLVPLQPYPVRDEDVFIVGDLEIHATLLDDVGLPLLDRRSASAARLRAAV
jgi:predicted component of type VI protein secretion system